MSLHLIAISRGAAPAQWRPGRRACRAAASQSSGPTSPSWCWVRAGWGTQIDQQPGSGRTTSRANLARTRSTITAFPSIFILQEAAQTIQQTLDLSRLRSPNIPFVGRRRGQEQEPEGRIGRKNRGGEDQEKDSRRHRSVQEGAQSNRDRRWGDTGHSVEAAGGRGGAERGRGGYQPGRPAPPHSRLRHNSFSPERRGTVAPPPAGRAGRSKGRGRQEPRRASSTRTDYSPHEVTNSETY